MRERELGVEALQHLLLLLFNDLFAALRTHRLAAVVVVVAGVVVAGVVSNVIAVIDIVEVVIVVGVVNAVKVDALLLLSLSGLFYRT